MIYYFFSSRRRHTRSYGDWSSDVCSSDLSSITRDGSPVRFQATSACHAERCGAGGCALLQASYPKRRQRWIGKSDAPPQPRWWLRWKEDSRGKKPPREPECRRTAPQPIGFSSAFLSKEQ